MGVLKAEETTWKWCRKQEKRRQAELKAAGWRTIKPERRGTLGHQGFVGEGDRMGLGLGASVKCRLAPQPHLSERALPSPLVPSLLSAHPSECGNFQFCRRPSTLLILLGNSDSGQGVTKPAPGQIASGLQNWHANSYPPGFNVHTAVHFFHVKEPSYLLT